MKKLLAVLCLLLFPFLGSAQNDSIPLIALDSVQVNAARLGVTQKDLPASVSIKQVGNIQQNLQQLSVNDYVQGVPGLFIQNANNFAQDARISIRGFGSRSAFGIRGVKLIIDGIPETTPDGQGQVDNVNLGLLESIEVLRGASSSLYGNASGGVINMQTLQSFSSDFVELTTAFGSYNFQNFQALAGLKGEKATTTIFANRTTTDGYRDNSNFETYQFNLRSKINTGKSTALNLQLNYTDSPEARDAGGINADAVAENRRQARDRNVLFDTGEAVRQLKTGAAFQWNTNTLALNSFAYYSYRDFANKLPFSFGGAVNLVRNYWGHGTNLSLDLSKKKEALQAQFGYEIGAQNDRRTRFVNNEGVLGDITLNQNELFNSVGAFSILQSKINNWFFRGGLRYDSNVLKVNDDFLSNGDASDKIVLSAFNPSIGVRYTLGNNQSIFANIASSFETPVLSELSADPENNGGFNQNLEQQTAITYELGYRYGKSNFLVESTLFFIETEGDIVPFELEAFPDRTFFRNAGSTQRLGLEVASTWYVTKQFRLNAAYTWSDFSYTDFILPSGNFNDNALPGIPKHLFSLQAQYKNDNGLTLRLDNQYRGAFFANDANTVEEDAALIANISASQKIQLSKFALTPFVGLNNIFNTQYSDNIRINAFGSRFFEPAPEFNVYVGLRLLMD